MEILRKYRHLFTRHWRAYAVGAIMLALTNAMGLAIPRVLGWAIDALEAGTTRQVLLGYGGGIVLLALLQAGARVGSRVQILSISRRVDFRLKGVLHDKLLELAPSFYGAANTGDLMSRMTNDVMLVRALAGPGVLYFLNAGITYSLGIIYMVSISWQLTVAVFLPLPVMAWLIRGLVHRIRKYVRASRVALSDLNTMVQENLTGVLVVKSFALEPTQEDRFEELSRDYMDWGLEEAWTRAQMIPLVVLGGGLATLAVLGLGARMVAAGSITPGDLIAFFGYIGLMVMPTVALGWILSLIQRGAAALERLDEILEVPTTIAEPVDPESLEDAAGTVEIADLTFRYDDILHDYQGFLKLDDEELEEQRRHALREVNFEAAQGEFVALVGRVGSGKSTLLKALLRLVEVPEGTVFVGGRDVERVLLAELRSRVAYVPQDDFLFSTTVLDNIAYGSPDAGSEAAAKAARLAGLGADLERFPDGLETVVGERGVTLSGGQRQRTALARALLIEAPILVLDNALSHVDADTEARILERLHEPGRRQRTLIVASNRVGAVRNADRIYVLEAGRVVDRGTHSELSGRAGLYATMVEQQRLSAELEEL